MGGGLERSDSIPHLRNIQLFASLLASLPAVPLTHISNNLFLVAEQHLSTPTDLRHSPTCPNSHVELKLTLG